MSDTKLREKADALIAFTQLGPRFIAWVEAVTDALAPAPEKVAKVCGNCGEKVSSLSDHVTCAETGDYYCQPAPPEPAAIGSPEWDKRVHSSAAKIALTTAGMTTTPEPAAPEMPEILSAVMDHLYQAAEEFAHYDEGDRAERCNHLRAELKSWWRNLAQPLAGGMTEELEHVLSIAERDLRYKEECFDNSARTVHDERIERLRAAIAAVREQCGRK